MKVFVSNPVRQHTHHLVYGLQRANYLARFATTIWYKPKSFPFNLLGLLPDVIRRKIRFALRKRYFEPLDPALISTHARHEWTRQIRAKWAGGNDEAWTFRVERKHDAGTARQVPAVEPDIVIGYEKSALHTFRAAKAAGAISVLDLAQVHCSHIAELAERYPIFGSIRTDADTLAHIDQTKKAEYEAADFIFALSTYARDTLIAGGIAPEKIKLTYLGFDASRFTPKSNYRHSAPLKLLFVGAMTKRKGIHLLLEAWQELNLPGAELHFIGPMADAGELVYTDAAAGIFYHSYMHHEDLVRHYQEADLFVFPSYLDSWAMVVLEAMACGTPVIVSEHTGAKDAVQQGGGKIVPVDDVAALTAGIRYYAEHPEIRELDGRKAAKIAQQYPWERYYDQVTALMQELKTPLTSMSSS